MKAGIATLMEDKIDFKPKRIIRQKRSLYKERGANTSRRYRREPQDESRRILGSPCPIDTLS